jgi:hypothetical protein
VIVALLAVLGALVLPARRAAADNHTWDLSPSCKLSVKGGHRFPAGARVLAFLKPNRSLFGGSAWLPVGGLAEAVVIIDDRRRLRSLEFQDMALGSLAEAQALIANVAGPAVAPDRPAVQAAPAGAHGLRWALLTVGFVAAGALLGLSVSIGLRRRRMP